MARWKKSESVAVTVDPVPAVPEPIEAPMEVEVHGAIRVLSVAGWVLHAMRGKEELKVIIPVNRQVPKIGDEIKIKTSGNNLILA